MKCCWSNCRTTGRPVVIMRKENNEETLEDLNLYPLNLVCCVFIVHSFWQAGGHLENPMLYDLGKAWWSRFGRRVRLYSILVVFYPQFIRKKISAVTGCFSEGERELMKCQKTESWPDSFQAKQWHVQYFKKGQVTGLQAGSHRDKAASVLEDDPHSTGV